MIDLENNEMIERIIETAQNGTIEALEDLRDIAIGTDLEYLEQTIFQIEMMYFRALDDRLHPMYNN